MAQRPDLRFANRGWRDLPSPSTRVRGAGELPYNPRRPLTLPGDRNPRRRPQFRGDRVVGILLPVLIIAGMGVGVFFGVGYLLGDDAAPAEAPAPAAAVAETAGADTSTAAATPATTDTAQAAEAEAAEAGPIDAAQASAGAAGATAEATPAPAAAAAAPDVVTEAQLTGAPASVDRAGATPIPSGVTGLTLADGSAYDPSDDAAALSSVWPAGTVLDLTRLPGGPLLTDEDAAELIGRTIQVVVVGVGEFPTELQLSPAAYERIARDFEPIIAIQISVAAAPQ